MELKEFIAETLSQIPLGIESAKEKVGESRANWIAAPIKFVGKGDKVHDTDVSVWIADNKVAKANLVRFDVAIHASERADGKAGIRVAGFFGIGIGAGVEGSASIEDKAISRMQFEIPLVLSEPPVDIESF